MPGSPKEVAQAIALEVEKRFSNDDIKKLVKNKGSANVG
jgi:hypothetical protein